MFFYIRVIKKLQKKTQKLINRPRTKHHAHRKVTLFVFSVISIYIISYTPFWINQIFLIISYSILNVNSHFFYQISSRVSTIFQIFLFFNSALNPYLYAFLSASFRENFKEAFLIIFNQKTKTKKSKSSFKYIHSAKL